MAIDPTQRARVDGGRSVAVGVGLAVISAVTFAGSGPLGDAAMRSGIGSWQLTWLRIALAALVVVVGTAVLRPRALRLRRHEWLLAVGFGLSGVAGAQGFFFAAVARLPVAIAMLIEFTAPVFVALWVRIVRRRRLGRVVWAGIALALAGLTGVARVWDVASLNGVGVAAAFGAAICVCAYYLIGERAVSDREPAGILAVGLLVGLLAATPIARPWAALAVRWRAQTVLAGVSLPIWAVIAALVSIATVTPYISGLASLRHLAPTAASVLGLLEPAVATVLAWWLIGQRLAALQIIGGVVVLSGATLVQVAISRHRPPAVPPEPGDPGPLRIAKRPDPCYQNQSSIR